MNGKKQFRETPSCRVLMRAWFSLTSRERISILVILGLIILGLCARYWHLRREEPEIYRNPEIRQEVSKVN